MSTTPITWMPSAGALAGKYEISLMNSQTEIQADGYELNADLNASSMTLNLSNANYTKQQLLDQAEAQKVQGILTMVGGIASGIMAGVTMIGTFVTSAAQAEPAGTQVTGTANPAPADADEEGTEMVPMKGTNGNLDDAGTVLGKSTDPVTANTPAGGKTAPTASRANTLWTQAGSSLPSAFNSIFQGAAGLAASDYTKKQAEDQANAQLMQGLQGAMNNNISLVQTAMINNAESNKQSSLSVWQAAIASTKM